MTLLRNIFAPSASDQEFLSQLIRDLTHRNAESSCPALSDLLDSSTEVLPRDVFPLLRKLTAFIETGKIESATLLTEMLALRRRAFFTAKELNPIMALLISHSELHTSRFAAFFLSVCAKSLTNVNQLISDPMDLAVFVPLAVNPMAAYFLTRAAQLVPALRVKFVFDGLIEQIIPTIGSNNSHLALLGAGVADPLSRKYVLDMNHLPRLVDALFASNLNDLATAVVRSLLDSTDLLHLNAVQKQLFELNFLAGVAQKVTEFRATEETIKNGALCLGDSIQYYSMRTMPFEINLLLNLLSGNPTVQTALLYVFENLAISNPELFPEDDLFIGRLDDPLIVMYLSYLSFDCRHHSNLDLARYRDLSGHSLALLLALGIQRRTHIEGADLWAQSPENAILRQLACANCFITGRTVLLKSVMVHHASLFFTACVNWINPFAVGSQAQTDFFPQSFLAWGADLFSLVNRGRLMHSMATWSMVEPVTVYDMSPDDSHEQLLSMNSKTSDVLRDNDLAGKI
jgi:hypothetical protein